MVLLCANHTQTSRCKNATFCKDARGTKEGYEELFEFLQAHFAITFQLWQSIQIYKLMFACVLLHIMVIEDEKDSNLESVKKS
jgi:hypothetical protein